MPHFASVRVERLKTIREIVAANAHANRWDTTSKERLRVGADSRLNLRHNPWRGDRAEDPRAPFDYVADFKAMKARRRVAERGGTAPIGHLICVISPGWIEEAGDVHDPKNNRNLKLFEHAQKWAIQSFGEGSVLSARMDMDEKGAGVVDVFVAPSVVSKKGKSFLSISPALKEIQTRYGRRNTFAGLQDSWAAYVQENLDPAIQRGKEKESVGPDRVTPENYAARAENERVAARLATQQAELDAAKAELAAERKRVATEKRHVEDRDWQLAADEAKRSQQLKADRADLAKREAALAAGLQIAKSNLLEQYENLDAEQKDLEQRRQALTERENKLIVRETGHERRLHEEAARTAKTAIDAANAKARMAELDSGATKHLAGMVRTIPFGRVMKMLGGVQDANDPLQWRLPNIGVVAINAKNPSRFATADKSVRGSGAVDLVKAETGLTFPASVRLLASSEPDVDIASDAAYAAARARGFEAANLIREKQLELNECAPAARNERMQVKTALVDKGISPEVIDAAFEQGQLEATKQGNRVFCRWTMRDQAGVGVGYALRSIDGGFSSMRGGRGIFNFDVSSKLRANDVVAPQIWVASAPEHALAALSVCNRLGEPALAPAQRATAVAIDGTPESLDALVKHAERKGAGVVLCFPNDAPGIKIVVALRERLNERKMRYRDLGWALAALKLVDWSDVAVRMQRFASKIIDDIRLAYQERMATAEARRKGLKNHGHGPI